MQIRVGKLRELIVEAASQAEVDRIAARLAEIVSTLKAANFTRLPKEVRAEAENARLDLEKVYLDVQEYVARGRMTRTTVGATANLLRRIEETFDDISKEKQLAKSTANWMQKVSEDIGHMARALINLGSGGSVRVQAWDVAAGSRVKNPYEPDF